MVILNFCPVEVGLVDHIMTTTLYSVFPTENRMVETGTGEVPTGKETRDSFHRFPSGGPPLRPKDKVVFSTGVPAVEGTRWTDCVK